MTFTKNRRLTRFIREKNHSSERFFAFLFAYIIILQIWLQSNNFFQKKMPERLHMCKIYSTFVPELCNS